MTPEEIKAMQDELAATKKAAESAQKLNESLKKTIIEQEKQAATAATTSTALLPTEPVTVDGKKYRIVFPRLIHKGKEYTAFQIAKDEALLKELVAMNSGALEAV